MVAIKPSCYRGVLILTDIVNANNAENLSDKELEYFINQWIEEQNKQKGYVTGLSDSAPVKNIDDIENNSDYLYMIIGNLLMPILGYKELAEMETGIFSLSKKYSPYSNASRIYFLLYEYFYKRLNFDFYNRQVELLEMFPIN